MAHRPQELDRAQDSTYALLPFPLPSLAVASIGFGLGLGVREVAPADSLGRCFGRWEDKEEGRREGGNPDRKRRANGTVTVCGCFVHSRTASLETGGRQLTDFVGLLAVRWRP